MFLLEIRNAENSPDNYKLANLLFMQITVDSFKLNNCNLGQPSATIAFTSTTSQLTSNFQKQGKGDTINRKPEKNQRYRSVSEEISFAKITKGNNNSLDWRSKSANTTREEMQTTPPSASTQPFNLNKHSISTPEQIQNQSQVAILNQTKKIKVPPITIDNSPNSTKLLKELYKLTGIKFSAKLTGYSLNPTPTVYYIIKRYIDQNNLKGYTYHIPNKKFLRVVFRRMPSDTPPIEIISDLENYYIQAQECFNMTNKIQEKLCILPLFLLNLLKTNNNMEIYNIDEIYIKISVEPLRKKLGPVQ
ncbi:hypothetical protein NPIL_582171 [Nephila pilipes]|uniref:Uncharacterized protein n=1 Tax=Nephila pilipes TaxID=299642 RepID=A0A8X6N8D4_NEPPI|nr:hypothetical protein NPIL_582171 [Nephila pilipes]